MNTTPSQTPLRQDLAYAARYYLRGWRGLVALAVVVAVPALWLGGPWLVAAGAVSLLISLAPCLVMCALGICMMKKCSKETGSDAAAPNAVPTADSTPVVATAAVDASGGAATTPRS